MPARSGKQYRMMAAIAHGAKPRRKGGPSRAIAREFVDSTPPERRSAYSKRPKRPKRRLIG